MTDKTLAEEIAGWPKVPEQPERALFDEDGSLRNYESWVDYVAAREIYAIQKLDRERTRLATCVRVMEELEDSGMLGGEAERKICTLLAAAPKEQGHE